MCTETHALRFGRHVGRCAEAGKTFETVAGAQAVAEVWGRSRAAPATIRYIVRKPSKANRQSAYNQVKIAMVPL